MELSQNSQIFLKYVLMPLYKKLKSGDVILVNNSQATVEIVGCHISGLNPYDEFIDYPDVLVANRDYIKKELEWYLSKDRSIDAIKDVKVWASCCDDDGFVNSNYGYRIFSSENDNQYEHALENLIADNNTRQSICIYTYPKIQTDWNKKGMHDMICTFSTQHFIRKNKLIYVVNMRSNDAILGFRNDFAWHCFVWRKMASDLRKFGIIITDGEIQWNAGSMHIYEARGGFDKLHTIINKYSKTLKPTFNIKRCK